jgi:hypothetical protein
MWKWASMSCALCVLGTACARTDDDARGPSVEVDASLIDNPVDEYGYSIVGESIYPPLYQRVEEKCVAALSSGAEECSADDDCGPGFACVCGFQQGRSLSNQCMPAECRSTADCNGSKCLLSLGDPAEECCDSGHLGLVCSRSESTCQHGGDCIGNGIACRYDGDLDYFECKPVGCSCGE